MSDEEAEAPRDEPFDGTVSEALSILGVTSSPVLEFFLNQDLMDETRLSKKRYSHDGIYDHIRRQFKATLFAQHPDKGGNDDRVGLHLTRNAWQMLKAFYQVAIVLSSDEESDGDASDEESDGDTSDHPCVVPPSPKRVHTHSKATNRANKTNKSAGAAQGRVLSLLVKPEKSQHPQYSYLINSTVVKTFWFAGTVASATARKGGDGKVGLLYHVEYEDGDAKDMSEKDLEELTEGKTIQNVGSLSGKCLYLGAIVWKQFALTGTVEECRVGELFTFFVWKYLI